MPGLGNARLRGQLPDAGDHDSGRSVRADRLLAWLEVVKSEAPVLVGVLLDVRMLVLNGLEAAAEIMSRRIDPAPAYSC